MKATGEGQVYGLFYLLPSLVQAYGQERLELEFADNTAEITESQYKIAVTNQPHVVIGGPIHNNWARAVMKYHKPQFTYGCMLPDKEDLHVLYDLNTGVPAYKPTADSDYGLIIQTVSKDRSSNNILLLSGNTTKGTTAASLAVSNPKMLKQIRDKIKHSSLGKHNNEGGCFFVKALGENVCNLYIDFENSNWGKINYS